MLTSTILSAIFLASGSMAQYYSGEGSWSSSVPVAPSSAAANAAASWTGSSWPSTTSSGTVMVQVVQVSDSTGSTLRYYPEKVVASPGSWVQFQFQPKVHNSPRHLRDTFSTANVRICLEPHRNAVHLCQPLRPNQQRHVQRHRYQVRLHACLARGPHPRLLRPRERHEPHLAVLRTGRTLPKGNGNGHQ